MSASNKRQTIREKIIQIKVWVKAQGKSKEKLLAQDTYKYPNASKKFIQKTIKAMKNGEYFK